jgi:hypothetical protein
MVPLVRVTYSGLTQSVFRIDRVNYTSCDCPEKIPVDVCSNFDQTAEIHRRVVRSVLDPNHRSKRMTFKSDIQEKTNELDKRPNNDVKIVVLNKIPESLMMTYQPESDLKQLT